MRIIVIEDNERVATLLKKGLTSQGYEVAVFMDAETAYFDLTNNQYDLVITDIMLPHMNGISLSKKIKHLHPELPILMLTALGTIDEKINGFDAGADDYMVKPFDMRELYVRVKVILNRAVTTQIEHSLKYDELYIDLDKQDVFRNEQKIELTPKEFKLLHFLMQNPERVLTRDEIAENVWGNLFDTGTNYIDVYIAYLRKKIDKNFEQKLIHTKAGIGFILTNLL
ncbi:DNA-binding response regulator, OmpR family, contains REC and winged-helix (wHTH) domain [Chishuiella changwenlii]|uniref:DNA-binding response regulator n=1 Tax=Chishuiella changwenlii TaxID=1434701 RepID=A0A1M7AKI8_9FLAO|nr:response regulator transcription factor [Chishuiella changwenlii]GGE90590.1 DNA-binding response regulator [Chishuiella changwenlii]SHL43274.1 DNA-binding response regulator, OmpR family, contains REC and winged-helix (wHTH) domain [Chishuiella changwenlii]